MDEAVREIRETAAKIIGAMNNDFVFAHFTADEINDIQDTVSMMVSDMEKAIGGEEVNIQPDEKEWVAKVLAILTVKVMVKPLDQEIKDMMQAYILIARNWNQIASFAGVDQNATGLYNAVNYHLTVTATIETMKKLMDQANMIMMSKPPAWEVSRHYLLTLRDKLERKENGGEQG